MKVRKRIGVSVFLGFLGVTIFSGCSLVSSGNSQVVDSVKSMDGVIDAVSMEQQFLTPYSPGVTVYVSPDADIGGVVSGVCSGGLEAGSFLNVVITDGVSGSSVSYKMSDACSPIDTGFLSSYYDSVVNVGTSIPLSVLVSESRVVSLYPSGLNKDGYYVWDEGVISLADLGLWLNQNILPGSGDVRILSSNNPVSTIFDESNTVDGIPSMDRFEILLNLDSSMVGFGDYFTNLYGRGLDINRIVMQDGVLFVEVPEPVAGMGYEPSIEVHYVVR